MSGFRRVFRWLEDTLGQGTVAITMMLIVFFAFLLATMFIGAI